MLPLPWKWLAPFAILLSSLLSSSSGAGERGTSVRGRESQGGGLAILFPVQGQEICREEDLELICTSNGYSSPRPFPALSRRFSHPHPEHPILFTLVFRNHTLSALALHTPFFPRESSESWDRSKRSRCPHFLVFGEVSLYPRRFCGADENNLSSYVRCEHRRTDTPSSPLTTTASRFSSQGTRSSSL